MARLSISTRLALWYGLSLLLLLGLVAGFLYVGFHLSLHRDFDAALQREAARLAALAPPLDGEIPEAFSDAARTADGAVHVISPQGDVLFRGGVLREGDAVPPPGQAGEAYRSHAWPSGPARTRYEPVPDSDGRLAAWVTVTQLESGLHLEMHRLGWWLALGLLLGVGVAALSGYGLARRALRPVAALTEAATRIGPRDQGARLPAAFGVRDELTDLADAFNALLARLDDAFERERRFRADAAHELLTPVTAAQSEVDVALRRDRDAGAYRDALRSVRGHTDRMADLVTGLLALSRAESAGRAGEEAVDFAVVARGQIERVRPIAQAKGVTLRCDLAEGVVARASAAHVATALENLIDNAVKYTPVGGEVTVTVRADEGDAVIAVADTGIGFTEDEGSRLFGRFYRADAPEVRRERGSGLGLAIARRLAELHGGGVVATSAGPERGSRFELRLPKVDQAATAVTRRSR